MSEKITVEKIEIKIGKKALVLTPAEMKELRDVLDATFPKETVYVDHGPIIIERPYYKDWPWRRWNEPRWMASGKTGGGDSAGRTMCLSLASSKHEGSK